MKIGLFGLVSGSLTYIYAEVQHEVNAAWPYAPFTTKGRDVVNKRSEVISWAGVNWPMSGETMVPEGLEWASVEDIIDMVASVGWNFIRMGYATEMIDQIYDREGEDVPLEVAMINALGYVNGTKVTSAIVEKNPSFKSQTTRFEILSHISEVAAKKGIFIHPDVHTSKAQWCCSHTDGNAWFGDKYFDIDRWLRGLKYVAHWAEAHDNVVSMSLRNELRESWNVTGLYYNWETFVGNMTRGADAIHEANPDLLITWSGLQYDQDLSALTSGKNLLTAPCYRCTAIRDALRRKPQYFDLDAHPWKDKLVWELHLYSGSEDIDTGTCEMIEAALYRNGFNALGISQPSGCNITNDCPPALRETPVIFSEFGHAQRPDMQDDVLQSCIKQFTQKHDISWMVWSLAGSFRIRSGVQGMEDTWGLTTADWSNWRFGEGIDRYWRPWVEYMNVTRRV